MTGKSDHMHPMGMDRWLALAAGQLAENDAATARTHLANCRRCRELFWNAREIHTAALELKGEYVDDVTRERMWRAVEKEAAGAARRVQRKKAMGIVWKQPWIKIAAAASILMLIGAGALIYRLSRRPGTRSVTPARTAESPKTSPDKGAMAAGLSSGIPAAVDTRISDDGPAQARRKRQRRGPARPRAGERRLRCGGVVAMAKAQARVVRDDEKTGIVRLASGQVKLNVPRLPAGGRVEVVTRDARVRVIGTKFSVRLPTEGGTAVSVARGTVWVMPFGRNRKTVVLTAGQQRTVLGEQPYLAQLRQKMNQAVSGGHLKEAARLGFRYLEVTSRPERCTTLKLQLAGILVRIGSFHKAVQLYGQVARGSSNQVARQNALAFLARLYLHRGQKAKAIGTWHTLVTRYPGGIYLRDALMQLVQVTCRKSTARAVDYRLRLKKRFSKNAAAQTLVRRCSP